METRNKGPGTREQGKTRNKGKGEPARKTVIFYNKIKTKKNEEKRKGLFKA